MTIVVGFVPTKEGRAALARSVEEAKTRRSRLVVINSNRGGRDVFLDGAERIHFFATEPDTCECNDRGCGNLLGDDHGQWMRIGCWNDERRG